MKCRSAFSDGESVWFCELDSGHEGLHQLEIDGECATEAVLSWSERNQYTPKENEGPSLLTQRRELPK